MIFEGRNFFSRLFKTRLAPWIISALVLFSGSTITTFLWSEAKQHQLNNLNNEFEQVSDHTANTILHQLEEYETWIRGLKAFVDGSENITVSEFRTYVDSLHLDLKKSGILGMGLVRIVPHGDKSRHELDMREQGISGYTIKPEGERSSYAPIIRMEPMSAENLKVLGLDVFTVPYGKVAMERARDLDSVSITRHFILPQEVGKFTTNSFVMYLPIFKTAVKLDSMEARRAAIQGWIDVPFRINDFMNQLGSQFAQDIDIEVYDDYVLSDESLIYQTHQNTVETSSGVAELSSKRQINFAGQTWVVLAKSTPAFEARFSNKQPHIVAIAGIIISILAALLTWFLVKSQQDARNRYTKLFMLSSSGILVLSRDLQILDANPAVLHMLSYSKAELLGKYVADILDVSELGRLRPIVDLLMEKSPHIGDWVHLRKDGTTFLAEVHARKLDNQTFYAILTDLTERKEHEHRIIRLSNLYHALSETNQAIIRMSDENELFPLACKCAVKFGGMQLAWIGEADESSGLIFPQASYGKSVAYIENLKVSVSAEEPEGRGPAGTALRENRVVIFNDFLVNPLTQPWHAIAKEFGWQSAGAFPVLRHGKPNGVFMVYSEHANAFYDEVVDLFKEMAADISFALENFERETERRVAQEKLKSAQIVAVESLDRYTDLYEFAPIGYLSINKDGRMIEVNWKVTSMFGRKRTLLNQHYFADFIVEADLQRWKKLFVELQALDAGEELNFDLNFQHLDGSTFIANLNCLRMDEDDGQPMLRVAMLDVTQLKNAEKVRQQLDVRLQATIDAIPDSLFEVDLNGQYYFAHIPKHELLALKPEDLIGKNIGEVLPTDAALVMMNAVYEANTKGKSEGKQFELTLEGGSFWFELSVSKKPEMADQALRFIILARDVTERRQFEIKLLQSSMGLENAQASVHLGSWELDLITMNGTWSLENYRLFGRAPELGAPSFAEYLLLIHPEDRHIIEESASQLETQIGIDSHEVRTNPTVGPVRTLSNTVSVVRDINGRAIRAIGTSLDITERKKTELELRIAATAFESQEGMMVTDADRIILKVNKAFTKISGYSSEEAIGQTPRLVSSENHEEDFYDSMWRIVDEHGGWEGEVWNRRKNGEIYPQHLTITAVFGNNNVVTNYVAAFTDVTLQNAAKAEINHLAFYDVLTHLPNRRLLIDRLNHALTTGVRLGWCGALLFLDLDHFKTLNDTLGHDIGDMLLRQVAERLSACIREGDTVARLGGDEFVVMLEDLSKEPLEAATQAEAVAQKILNSISQHYQLGKNAYQTTASIGIVLFTSNDHSQDLLLKHADIAMYQAKKMGRNTMCFFDPNMQEAINSRVALEVDLRGALEAKQFELYYQIQVDRLGQAVGAEALIRWIHPERGLVSPLEFIPLAEETGLILPIGHWVLEAACIQLKSWQKMPKTQNLTLSINVSAKQFYQKDFAMQVASAIQQYGINPTQLKLELTESIMLENFDTTVVKMKELQNIGVQFSLDDFGTGYSSLQYLKLLPIYQLKIDRSFVTDIALDTSDQAIVRTVIAMAETLNLDVIAEGVETEEQRDLLMNCGCNTYQGFLFGKPVPISQFDEALQR